MSDKIGKTLPREISEEEKVDAIKAAMAKGKQFSADLIDGAVVGTSPADGLGKPAVGDINSNEMGTGARYNAGKVPWELLPLRAIMGHILQSTEPDNLRWVRGVLSCLALFQAGDNDAIRGVLNCTSSPDYDLASLKPAVLVFDYGRKTKYKEWNWAKGMLWSVPIGCIVRHCLKVIEGEENDEESGLPHLGHIQCNALMLLTYQKTFPQGDDRPKRHLEALL